MEPEFYLPNDDCANGASCPGEGVFIPQQIGNTAMDAMFVGSEADIEADLGLANLDSYPLSDEVFPVIYDDAPLTYDGLMDCFARQFPERAQFLSALIENEGYTIDFVENVADRLSQLTRDAVTADRYASQLGGGVLLPSIIPSVNAMEQRGAALAAREEIARLENWHFRGRTLVLTDIVNTNIDATTLQRIDLSLVNFFPTNAEGAEWLNAVIGDFLARSGSPGADSSEEFADPRRQRVVWGTVNVVFGAAEVIGGIVLTVGAAAGTAVTGGASSVGIVAGGAMTIAGFEAITQGIDMWRTPNEASHGAGWLGDGAFAMMNEMGVLDEDDQASFNRYWSFAMLGLSLGGAGVLGYAGDVAQANRAGSVASNLDFVSPAPARGLASARQAIVGVKNARFGQLTISFAPLPSGRVAMNIKDVGRVVAPHWESLPRLRLRANTSRSIPRLASNFQNAQTGPASLRNMASQSDAQRLVDEAAQHMGFADVSRYVDEVRVTDGSWSLGSEIMTDGGSSFFTVFEGRRILALSPTQINGSGQAGKLITAAHELVHAKSFNWLSGSSPLPLDDFTTRHFSHAPYTGAYMREEILAEGIAQRRVLRALDAAGQKVDPRDLRESIAYLKDHSDAYREFLQTGQWNARIRQYYGPG